MGLKKGQSAPAVPFGFAFAAQHTAYQLGILERYRVLYHTPQTVRCKPDTASPCTMRLGVVWAFHDEAVWQQVVTSYTHYQACLTTLAERLRAYGTYSQLYTTQAKAFGGVRYPLARWVIEAPHPDVTSGWLVNERQPPSVRRHQVARHTEKMVMTSGGERLFQAQVFVCRTEAAWQAVDAEHALAVAAGHQFADLVQRVPRYADLVEGQRSHAA